MRKIMLVIDEFNELEFLESLLRRLSFDVLSLSKDLSVPSAILGFFPDLVMAQAKSRAVDGIVLSQKVRKLAPQARMVLLHPIGQPPRAGAELKHTVDAFLEMPVDPAKLIAMLSQLGSLDEKVLQDKLNRIAAGKMSEEKRTRLQGKGGTSTQSTGNNMVGGGSGSKPQSDVVHVTSKTPGASQHTVVSGKVNQPFVPGMKTGGADGATGDDSSKGIHHFQGTNTLKGATHISGEAQKTGAAYDPTGEQEAAKRGGGTYVPSPAADGSTSSSAPITTPTSNSKSSSASVTTSTSNSKSSSASITTSTANSASTGGRRASAANAEVTSRTKGYDQFLASHDEPADKVIPQGEMKRQAKIFKLDKLTASESELDQKREFVRALFRK